jgi:hypothetical protein
LIDPALPMITTASLLLHHASGHDLLSSRSQQPLTQKIPRQADGSEQGSCRIKDNLEGMKRSAVRHCGIMRASGVSGVNDSCKSPLIREKRRRYT